MFAVAGLATFIATFESSSINIALPTISRSLGTNLNGVSWVILAYTLTIGPTLLLFAKLSGRIGIKPIYLVGFSLFLIGCVICGMAGSLNLLVAGRVCQGLGASMIISLGPAVITHAFPKGERGKGMGMVGMIVGAGLLLGPAVGGTLVGSYGWESIFYAPIPLTLLAFALVFRLPEWRGSNSNDEKLNYVSSAFFFVALASFLYGLKILNEPAEPRELTIALFVIAVLFTLLFILRERKKSTRLIGLEVFESRNVIVSVACMFLVFVSSSAIFILIPFFVERELAMSTRQAGLFLAVIPMMIIILAPLSGRLADKIGARIPTIVGLFIMSGAFVFMRELTPEQGIWGPLGPLIVFGFGMGLFGVPNSSDLMGSVRTEIRELASGVLSTTRTLSLTFGVALSSALFVYWSTNAGAGDTISAYQNVFTFSLVCVSVAIPISFFREPGRR